MSEIQYPEIRYVSAPIHLDDSQSTGDAPRMRHLVGCGHFVSDGKPFGTPIEATDEQMRSLPACKSCIEREFGSDAAAGTRRLKYGEPCPTCFVAVPLSGVCENCA